VLTVHENIYSMVSHVLVKENRHNYNTYSLQQFLLPSTDAYTLSYFPFYIL
jgi:hypothetical protein